VAEVLPRSEDFNLKSQITRAATSVALNIAEGSQGQSDAEQARFLSIAIRSLIETVACQQIIQRRGYLQETKLLQKCTMIPKYLPGSYKASETLYQIRDTKFGKITQRKMIA